MTIYDFLPNSNSPFQFSPTLDRQVYTATVTWSFFGVRYMLNIYSSNGSLIVSKALIGSPSAIEVQAVTWANGYATYFTRTPHLIPLLTTVDLITRGFTPDQYNGALRGYVSADNEITVPMPVNPGTPTLLGDIENGINLIGGYFNSRMVYREINQQFEVTP